MWFGGKKGGGLFGSRNRKRRRTMLTVDARASDRRRIRFERLRILLFALAVFAGAGVALWFGARAVVDALAAGNDVYTLRELHIESDGPVITPEKVAEWTGVRVGQNLFAVRIGEMRRLLLQVPQIEAVEMRRLLPDRLEIRIAERTPIARLHRGGYFGLDRRGHVFGVSPALTSLPYVTGFAETPKPGSRVSGILLPAVELLDVLNRGRLGSTIRVLSVDVSHDGELRLRLVDGENVCLAWTNMGRSTADSRLALETKLHHLARGLQASAGRGRRIDWIDLTFGDDYIPAREE